MKSLIEFCIKRPVTIVMFFSALMILGVFSGLRMPIDLMPDITFPAINISTSYSGAGPEEIEELVTIPVEQAVSTVNGVKSISSTSSEGRSRVTVFFDWGVDLEEATNDIRANLDRIRQRLPDGAGQPSLFKFNPSSMPVVTIGLSGDLDEDTLRQLAEDDFSYQIQKVEGVANVEVRGGRNREIRVYLKRDRLLSLGISFDQVVSALKNENVMQPAGNLGIGTGDFLLRTKGEFTSIDDIRNLIVLYREGVPIYLRDLADVEEGFETARSLVRIDGLPGVVLSVQKRSGSNTVAVADRIYKALDELRRQNPDIKFRILNDNSTYIRKSVQSVRNSAIMGAVLAGLVLLMFLHSIRATLITAVVMPISILTTMMLAYFSNMTLNTISLGGLALGVGMLVDNSVVVLDNVFRKFQDSSLEIKQAVLEGASEMGPAILASTLTTVCVFFPLIFVGGQTGIIFKELSYMVSFSLLCSIGVAITLMPMLCSKYLTRQDAQETETHNIKGYLIKIQHGWENSYQRLLEWCLAHKLQVMGISLIVFAALLCLWPLIGTQLIQTSDEGIITLRLDLPTGTRLEETDALSLEVENLLRDMVPELENMEASVGGMRVHQATITLRLKSERNRTTEEVVEFLREKIQFPGVRVRVNARNSMRMLYGSGSQNAIEIDIRGYDQELAREAGEMVVAKLNEIPGITDATVSREEERPELAITVNRKRAADMGVTVAKIANALETAIEGQVATIFRKNGEEVEVRVNLQEKDRQSWQDLERIVVSGSNNQVVPLMGMVEISQNNSPVEIERKDQERNLTVQANYTGRDLSAVMADVKQALDNLRLPPGISLYYAGDYEEQQKSFNDLKFALILALVLVYMVMAAQFESYLDPLLIMLLVPFTLGGVLLMLFLTDTNFDNQVYIGLIVLGGVVVNNAIVLVSYYRLLMERGIPLKEAVIVGSRSRLRPILITTVTTMLGLAPLALGLGEGDKSQASMARTVIGGLCFSSIVNLILMPVVFMATERYLREHGLPFIKKKPGQTVPLAVILLLLAGLALGLSHPGFADGGRVLTLEEAIRLGLQNSEESKIIEAKRIKADAAYRQNTGKQQWQVTSTVETVAESGKTETVAGLEATRSVPLAKLRGVQSLNDQIAEANRTIALLSADEQEQQLIYDIIKMYQAEILTESSLKIAENNYQRSKRSYDEVMTRSQLGLTTVTDETGAEAQLSSASSALNRARYQYRNAQLKLRQTLGLDPDEPLTLIALQPALAQYDLKALTEDALRERADIKQAQEELEQARKLLELARLAQRIGLSLDWSFEREHVESSIGISNLDRSGTSEEWYLNGTVGVTTEKNRNYSKDGTLTLKLSWNLWDGEVRRQRVREAEAEVVRLEQALKKLEKEIILEVEAAYYDYLNQQDQLKSSELQLKHNQIYLEATEAKFRAGLVPFKDVLDAQVGLNQSELNYQQTLHDAYLAEINLKKVSGRLRLTNFVE